MIKQLFSIPIDEQLTWLWLLLAGLFLISFLVQLIFLLRFFNKIPAFKKLNEKTEKHPVSVIICARDQAENLKHFLPTVLNQFYPNFEVIVVNDGSTDDTEEVLSDFKRQYKNLYVTGIEGKRGYISGKKVALTLGIKAAKHDQLVFTDADCEPLSPNWLNHMQSNFLQKTDIILGYGGYKSRKGFLNKWIRTDTVYLAMRYLSFAIIGNPYMGVGRNLAYRRSLFFEKKGFATHLHIPTGDDELFVNENATRYNTAIEIHPESHTMSEPKNTWKQWLAHKRKQLKSSSRYKKSHKRVLNLEISSRLLLLATGITLLTLWKLAGFIIILLLIREIIYSIIFKLSMKRLKEKNLLLISLLYDLFWPFIKGILIFRNKFAPKTPKWQ